MSRIGKLPIKVPTGVKVAVSGRVVNAEGPKGKLSVELPKLTNIEISDEVITITRDGETREAKAMHGLARSLVNNMVTGVHENFVKRLEIQGVGFKADVKGSVVNLSLGYSHPLNYPIPEQIDVKVTDGVKISIEGPDKQVVGRVASEIRGYYPAEPYKGKGVRYDDEVVVRKEGKTVQ